MAGTLLGLFMVAVCGFATLLQHPGSPARQVLPDGNVRRLLMGLAMGLTAIGLIHSPWGQQSGTHMNLPLQLRRPGRDYEPAADQHWLPRLSSPEPRRRSQSDKGSARRLRAGTKGAS